jgi:hypothetical protein
MAKMAFKDKEDQAEITQEEKQAEPSISFTENEVKEVIEFVNYFAQHHDYTGNVMKFDQEYKPLFMKMTSHIKKLESYILEVKRVSKSK